MTRYFTHSRFAATHAFFTRNLPGSTHNYRIMANRTIAMHELGLSGESLCIVEQKHTPDVVTVTTPWPMDSAPVADAMVTTMPGLALGVLTADCTPVLFADMQAGVIGAAHAGWKGAKAGVVENTLKAMLELGASLADIHVAIGPCIQQYSYEVGPEFYENFLTDASSNAEFFIPSTRTGHFMFDMPAFVTSKLQQAGVTSVYNMQRDTCSDTEHFFSYRRCCLRKEIYNESLLSAIVLV